MWGLALRVGSDAGPADIELASTGLGVPTRFALVPYWSPSRARLTTVLPYRGDDGPVLLAARTIAPRDLPSGGDPLDAALERHSWRVRLYFARPAGRWHPFADAVLRRASEQDDRELRFDAVRHLLPGAGTYAWTAAVREPSYLRTQGDLVDARLPR